MPSAGSRCLGDPPGWVAARPGRPLSNLRRDVHDVQTWSFNELAAPLPGSCHRSRPTPERMADGSKPRSEKIEMTSIQTDQRVQRCSKARAQARIASSIPGTLTTCNARSWFSSTRQPIEPLYSICTVAAAPLRSRKRSRTCRFGMRWTKISKSEFSLRRLVLRGIFVHGVVAERLGMAAGCAHCRGGLRWHQPL